MTAIRTAAMLAALLLAAPAAAQETRLPDNSAFDLDPNTEGTEEWRSTVEERDRQTVDEARETGETVISTQVGEVAEPATDPAAAEEETAATARPETGYAHQDTLPVIHDPSDVLDPAYPGMLAGQDLSDLLGVLIEEWSRPPEIVALSYEAASARPAEEEPPPAAPGPPALTLDVEAGRPLYARTLYEVNSDFPGPVLIEILEPPLGGAVATGTFTQVRDSMVLRLTRVENDGMSVPVDGWAVGLDCACFGIEGDVDRHWFDRVIMPAAVAFVEGWSRALARPQTTVNVDGGIVVQSTAKATARQRVYEGIAAATGPAAAVLQEDAPGAMTVRIPAGTELAVTFASAPDVAGLAFGGDEVR